MPIPPLDRVGPHLHHGLAQVVDLLVRQRCRVTEADKEVVYLLKEDRLAIELDVNLALELPGLELLTPRTGRADGVEELIGGIGLRDVRVRTHAEPSAPIR